MKLKPQWNTNIHLLEQLKLKIVIIPNADKDTEKLDHSYIDDTNVKWYCHSEKITWPFPKNYVWFLLYDPAIVLLGIYPREIKAHVHTIKTVHNWSLQLYL